MSEQPRVSRKVTVPPLFLFQDIAEHRFKLVCKSRPILATCPSAKFRVVACVTGIGGWSSPLLMLATKARGPLGATGVKVIGSAAVRFCVSTAIIGQLGSGVWVSFIALTQVYLPVLRSIVSVEVTVPLSLGSVYDPFSTVVAMPSDDSLDT